ncbi:hypothetical protein NPIL_703261 [Nephila pilipes]|uniref:Uncharacterized protein n=1 Tax=Nephila pilipes TaxID=299642 RepID=A0A8X6U735_NEPPI|nr:hypothetical protein NPIL_703261 [Nephila pilipes]
MMLSPIKTAVLLNFKCLYIQPISLRTQHPLRTFCKRRRKEWSDRYLNWRSLFNQFIVIPEEGPLPVSISQVISTLKEMARFSSAGIRRKPFNYVWICREAAGF